MVANRFDYLHFNVPICSICQGCADSLFYSNPLLLSPYPFHPGLLTPLPSPRVSPSSPFVFSPLTLLSLLLLSLPFFPIPLYLSHFIVSSPLTPHAFICLSIPTLHPLSRLSFSLLSHFHPSPLILPVSSHLIPLSAHPFIRFPVCQFSYFTDCLS